MKKIQLLLLTICVALGSMAASKPRDVVILRNGDIFSSKVNQITAKSLIFENYTNGVESDQYPLSDVYMVKYAKRGNVYFMPDGRRMTGENQLINYAASIIYTVDYKEIQAFDIVMELGTISYSKKKPTKKDRYPSRYTVEDTNVFMIIYPDGTKEIFSDLSKVETPQEEVVEKTTVAADTVPAKPELKVVFYTTVSGDNLAKIAKKHDVEVEEIREWNELPASLKPTSPIRKGTQLMLYIKPI